MQSTQPLERDTQVIMKNPCNPLSMEFNFLGFSKYNYFI